MQRLDDEDADNIVYEITSDAVLTPAHWAEIAVMFRSITLVSYYRFYYYGECKTKLQDETYFMAWVPMSVEGLKQNFPA